MCSGWHRKKAETVARRYQGPDIAVLAADTTVVMGATVLGKPGTGMKHWPSWHD
ncbi:MAG: hypothetical protein R3E50_08450 [Halioglobus sp.]